MSSSLVQRLRPWARRAAVVGGATAGILVAFPHFEDAYWRRKDPKRVLVGESEEGDYAPKQKQQFKGKTKDEQGSLTKKKKLVILGTGWASVSVLKHIDRDMYDITIVSPRNFFLFTPLLPVCLLLNYNS